MITKIMTINSDETIFYPLIKLKLITNYPSNFDKL